MKANTSAVAQYLDALPEERKSAATQLHNVILKNLPRGFESCISYGMPGYVVPLMLYPSGYHCNPSLPLPFMSFASQKNFIAVYHMGIYADPDLMDWFVNAYDKSGYGKPDMGKSCIRFKNINKIPFELIGQLASRMTPKQWIELYEKNYKKK